MNCTSCKNQRTEDIAADNFVRFLNGKRIVQPQQPQQPVESQSNCTSGKKQRTEDIAANNFVRFLNGKRIVQPQEPQQPVESQSNKQLPPRHMLFANATPTTSASTAAHSTAANKLPPRNMLFSNATPTTSTNAATNADKYHCSALGGNTVNIKKHTEPPGTEPPGTRSSDSDLWVKNLSRPLIDILVEPCNANCGCGGKCMFPVRYTYI